MASTNVLSSLFKGLKTFYTIHKRIKTGMLSVDILTHFKVKTYILILHLFPFLHQVHAFLYCPVLPAVPIESSVKQVSADL